MADLSIKRLKLKNWRNFRQLDATTGRRVFIVGPNASGKSNLLDALRFLSDIAKPGGGLQSALKARGELTKIRCLAARQDPIVEIELHFEDESKPGKPDWIYRLAIEQEQRGKHLMKVKAEEVIHGDESILTRPDEYDEKDKLRLTQTSLEQISANQRFREIYDYLSSVSYRHLVPQLVRTPDSFRKTETPDDPYGRDFLQRLSMTNKRARDSRLRRINEALKAAVPQLQDLQLVKDESGKPHLEAHYKHWRKSGARQRETQFSDGTIRLIGLLYSLLENDSLLLLEEPELSLHTEIVRKLPALFHRLQKSGRTQIFISTHSAEILEDTGIGGEEVLLLRPTSEGTSVQPVSDIAAVRTLLETGISIADATRRLSAPESISQLDIFG